VYVAAVWGDTVTKYGVILADPPWAYKAWDTKTNQGRTAESYYPTMNVDRIGDLDIPAADNCALFLWATWPCLPDALAVMDAWGFTYKTIAWTWAKLNRSGLGFHFGMGYYTRANTEPCLLAVKGNMPVATHDVQALIVSPVREHSRKPDEQYGKIERLYPDVLKLELFARRPRPGWAVWGNEVESDIEIAVGD
jgi:N6-adenosine-specific RNA methylase IME4